MKRPTDEEIDAYCKRFNLTPDVAWRDYLQLRLAEATSRDASLFQLCVWKGAFVMRFVLQSYRGSGDLDATVGTNKDRVDPQHMYQRLKRACHDLEIESQKLTSGKDHNARALEGVKRRYEAWDRERGRDLPRDGGPTKDEMRDACNSAVNAWVP